MSVLQFAGMAGEIRASTASEQFDLAGMSETKITDMLVNAFGTPLDAPTQMVSFKFVVGGGKLVRAKYNDDMPRWVNAALRSIEFESDNSAAETLDSQRSFKQQHDTGKNLIYIIVYPAVACTAAGADDGEKEDDGPHVDTKSPEYLCTASTLATFKEIVQRKLPFWRQRKACLKVLQDAHEAFGLVEQKMCTGKPLTPIETASYESNSGQDEEKIAFLQAEIKSLVDNGELTKEERDDLVKTLTANAAEATTAGQAKKAENILQRKATLQKSAPIVGRLRLGDEIQKQYMKVFPLNTLEEKSRSMSLTIADLQALSEKDDLMDKIAGLQNASRGWFERDEDFTERCIFEEEQAKKRYLASKGTAKKGGGLGSKGRTAAPKGTQSNRGQNLYNSNIMATIGRRGNSGGGVGGNSGGSSAANAGGGAKKAASLFAAFGDDSD